MEKGKARVKDMEKRDWGRLLLMTAVVIVWGYMAVASLMDGMLGIGMMNLVVTWCAIALAAFEGGTEYGIDMAYDEVERITDEIEEDLEKAKEDRDQAMKTLEEANGIMEQMEAMEKGDADRGAEKSRL